MSRVEKVVNWQIQDACASDAKVPWPNLHQTAAILPFYGGALKKRDADVDTGNSHSRQPRSLKLRALKANVCALLRSVAQTAVVALTVSSAGHGYM